MSLSLGVSGLPDMPSERSLRRAARAEAKAEANSPYAKTPITVQSWTVDPDKPLATGSGVSCSIHLAEPHVYLYGLNSESRRVANEGSAAAVIRGKLRLTVEKTAKIRAVTLKFYGKARTEWPEGVPPTKTRRYEEKKLDYQLLPFYNALFSSAEDGYGAQCNYILENEEASSSTTSLNTKLAAALTEATRTSRANTLSARDQRRLSLQAVQSRSFQKRSSPGVTTPRKGYKTFHPGVYEYSFEIKVDHTSPETINLPMGSIRWVLESIVERAGTFKPNLHGTHEVLMVRAPDISSQTLIEPICISRDWQDQIHYDIMISGKAFPIGSKMPMAIKLTPLKKIHLHRIRIFITESVIYHCRDKHYSRLDTKRKVLALERWAGKPLAKEYSDSEIRFQAGGEPSEEQRARARAEALSWRRRVANVSGTAVEPLPEPVDSLMGDITLGLDHLVCQTEMEVDVQLPTCEQMRKDKSMILHPDSSYTHIEVNHWIKIILRISELESNGKGGRLHEAFEVSIDSPIIILSCLATRSRTALPEYCGSNPGAPTETSECGCPNAAPITSSNSTTSTRNNLLMGFSNLDRLDTAVPAEEDFVNSGTARQRPMHMLRYPSFSPPAFEAEQPPPTLETPPPKYDHVIGTPSHDGLADYFARMADVYDDDNSEDERELSQNTSRTGRVNVPNPRTPGQRAASHSMDINRNFMFRPETFNPRLPTARSGGDITPRPGNTTGNR